MNLTRMDRLILINQFLMLEKLYPDEEQYYKRKRTALEEGYVLHYDWLFENMLDEELSEEKCKEIFEILSMYRAIYNTTKKLSNSDEINSNMLEFKGVDGNSEYKEFAYINYIINDLSRFAELKYNNEFADFNSHLPMMYKYRAMLQFWNTLDNRQDMKLEELKALLEIGELAKNE